MKNSIFSVIFSNSARKRILIFLFSLLAVILSGCTSDEVSSEESGEDPTSSSEVVTTTWESFLPSIQGENIKNVEWIIYGGRELPSNDEVAQLIRNSVSSEVHSSYDELGEPIWSLWMYVSFSPDDGLDADNLLGLSAGFTEDLVCISGGTNLPDGYFYVDDSDLYWMVRSMYDSPTTIDEAALTAYQDTIDQYIADEQSSCGNPAVTVELLSLEKRLDRSDIGVEVYTVGTVWTSDSPEELLPSMAGGAYFDSQLRLHPDGNSKRFYMLVINGTPVGFLNWEALDAIESQDISSSEDVMDILLSQGVDWFKAI